MKSINDPVSVGLARLPLPPLEIFAAIARHGGFRPAADALGLTPSTVSHQLRALEERMGTKLFIRTTRSVQLTEAGRILYRGAAPAFEQLGEAVENARRVGRSTSGVLRLTMPDFVYTLFVAPVLKRFSADWPDIAIELSLTDAFTDLVDEGFHAGFRLGDRVSPEMIAIRLTAPLPLAVVAAPSYWAAHGAPARPADLLAHNCIRYRFQTSGRIAPWTFRDGDDEFAIDVRGAAIVNTIPPAIDLARRGLGVIYTFRDLCAEEIAAGVLAPALERFTPTTPGVFLYFPREYRAMTPLRLFIDHVKEATPAS